MKWKNLWKAEQTPERMVLAWCQKKKKTLVSVCGVFLSETMFSSSVWSVSMVSAFTDQSG